MKCFHSNDRESRRVIADTEQTDAHFKSQKVKEFKRIEMRDRVRVKGKRSVLLCVLEVSRAEGVDREGEG